MLRIGIYLGRHANFGGGMLVYAQELVMGLVEEFAGHNFTRLEVVLYGDQCSLTEEFKNDLLYSAVVVSLGRFPFDGGANTHFKALPNGAKCKVLIRQLPCFRVKLISLFYDLFVLPWLFLIDRLSIVHCTSNMSVFWCPCPVILTLHDFFQGWSPMPTISYYQKLREFFYRAYFYLQFNRLGKLNKRGAVITVSERVKYELVNKFDFEPTKVSVIPLGLDQTFVDAVEFFRQDRSPAFLKTFLESRQLKGGYVCILASADPRKNLEKTLYAWLSMTEEQRTSGVLIILSDPRSKNMVLSILGDEAGKDYVWIIEKCLRSELPYYFKAASVLLVPTLAEGFGLPALEARFMGCNVVSGKLEHFDRVRRRSGTDNKKGIGDVYICDPTVQQSIAQALVNALHNYQHFSTPKAPKNTINTKQNYPRMRSISRLTAQLYENIYIRVGTS